MLFFDDDLDTEINNGVNVDKNKRKSNEKNEIAEKRENKDKDSNILIRRTGKSRNNKKQKYILTAIFLISLILFFFSFSHFGFFDKFRAFINLNKETLHISAGKEDINSKNDEQNESPAAIKEEPGFALEDEEAVEELNGDLSDENNSKDLEEGRDESAGEENDRESKKDDIAQDKINNENNNSGLLYSISEISDPFSAGEGETTSAEAENELAGGSAEETNGSQSAANMLNNADKEVNGRLIESEKDIIQAPVNPVDQDSSSDIENTAEKLNRFQSSANILIDNADSTETLNYSRDSKDNKENFDERTGTTGREVLVDSAEVQDKKDSKNIKIEGNENEADNEAGVESNVGVKSKDSAKSSLLNVTEDKNKEVEKVELKIPFTLRGTIVDEDQAEALFFHNNTLISRKVGEEIEEFKILEITKIAVLISFMDFEHRMHIWGHDKVEAAE